MAVLGDGFVGLDGREDRFFARPSKSPLLSWFLSSTEQRQLFTLNLGFNIVTTFSWSPISDVENATIFNYILKTFFKKSSLIYFLTFSFIYFILNNFKSRQ